MKRYVPCATAPMPHGTATPGAGRVGATTGGATGGAWAWEEHCFPEACRLACAWATTESLALDAALHRQRPRGYVVEGFRAHTLVTRFGDVRVRRRLYRAPDGSAHFLSDEQRGWPPRQVATPTLAALLVDWASAMPFAVVAQRLAQATTGVVGGSTVWRLLQHLAQRVLAQEQTTHATWADTAALNTPVGERVVPVLYVEADGVWVKTQRETAHKTGYELKCASMYEDCPAASLRRMACDLFLVSRRVSRS